MTRDGAVIRESVGDRDSPHDSRLPGDLIALLEGAEQTLNAKLMDLANHTLERHRTLIEDVDSLLLRSAGLNAQYRSYGTQLRMARIDDARTMSAAARPG